MSKKNLSLLMDGFMGEANPTDQAKELPQEQQVEQTAKKRNSQKYKMIRMKARRQHLRK